MGLRDRDACYHWQYIDACPVQPGLALTFPNIHQHPQPSFALLDQTKFGRRTLVSFLPVDPEVKGVVGTAEVAPQQQPEGWTHRAVEEVVDLQVPGEVVNQVVDGVGGTMNVPGAKEYVRESLFVRS